MFKLTRRSSTVALLTVAALGSGLTATSASAQTTPAGPPSSLAVGTPTPEPVALLLPAVQKVREAAARMKCAS